MDCQQRDREYPITSSQSPIPDRRTPGRTEGRLVVVVVITVLVLFPAEPVVVVLMVAVVVAAVVWLTAGTRGSINVIVVAIIGLKEQRTVMCYAAAATAQGNRA